MADLTKQRRAELRRLAEEATPGPWIQRHEKHYDVIWDNDGFRVCGNVKRADASYIAAADPQTVLALLDALDVAEEAFKLLDKVNGAFVCPAVVDSRHCPHPETTSCIKPDNCGQRDTIGGECWHEWAYREARAAVAARQGRQD